MKKRLRICPHCKVKDRHRETTPGRRFVCNACGHKFQRRKDSIVGGKIGPPLGSRNNLTTGLTQFGRKSCGGLDVFREGVRWPRGTAYVPRITKVLADQLRGELCRIHGSTTVLTEALISSALTHEARALLIERMHKKNKKTLSVMEQAELLDKIGKARDQRDRCLERMGLRIKPAEAADIWQAAGRLAEQQNGEPELIATKEAAG
jgi:hypothetical protein